MTTLENFKLADKKVTEIENNGGLFIDGYITGSTKEYNNALKVAKNLYNELLEQGINPFN